MRSARRWKIAGLLGVMAVALVLPGPALSHAQARFGPQSAEGTPGRRQEWAIPSPDTATVARAILYRPAGPGPFRLAVIAHASTQNALRRAQMPSPEYRPLAMQLVERGFAVLVPERPGHGATGGPYLEDQGGCDDADYVTAGRATAAAIRAAVLAMQDQPFIRREGAVIVGHSAGGWGALALASSELNVISQIVVLAPGRGGYAGDRPFAVCAEARLMAAAGVFGKAARIPVTWLVAQNDSYFSPALSQRMADAFRSGGAAVDFRVLPASGDEGHWLAERDDARDLVPAMHLDLKPATGKPVPRHGEEKEKAK